MLHQGFNHDFMKLRKTFVCTKKTKITLFNDFFSQSSTGFHDSTRMHAYGAADAGTAAVCKKQKKTKHTRCSCEFFICVLKINQGLTGLERHECE